MPLPNRIVIPAAADASPVMVFSRTCASRICPFTLPQVRMFPVRASAVTTAASFLIFLIFYSLSH